VTIDNGMVAPKAPGDSGLSVPLCRGEGPGGPAIVNEPVSRCGDEGRTLPTSDGHGGVSTMTTMHEALAQAMGQEPDAQTVEQLQAGGVAVLDVDTMSQAIHDVYCGIMADHQHPNQKDKDQAQAMIAAIQKYSN
jgi:hypothetical protein